MKCLLLVMTLFVSVTSFADFAKYIEMTVNYTPTASVEGFPVLVRLNSSRINYADVKNAGADLKFTDASGETVYPHEVDTWNPAGESLVWVRLPELAKGAKFRMYYGDQSVTANPSAANVWSAYAGVWHLNAAVDSANKDYKPEGGTTHTTRFYDCARVLSDGVLGKGLGSTAKTGAAFASQVYDNRDGYKRPIQVTNPSEFTVSCWVRVNSVAAWSLLFGPVNQNTGNTGWKAEWTADGGAKMRLCQYGGDGSNLNYFNTPDLASGWHKLDAIWDVHSLILYIDGAFLGEKTNCPGEPIWFLTGWMGWGGCIDDKGALVNTSASSGTDFDECRIYNAVKSAARIAADYATVKNADFLMFQAARDNIGEPGSVLVLH